jgi:hypothetical protein
MLLEKLLVKTPYPEPLVLGESCDIRARKILRANRNTML